MTWACEHLQGYPSHLDFTIQTDRKPLITHLKPRALGDFPQRRIKFRLRLLRFYFNIIPLPVKNLITADTLSRAPLPATATEAEQDLEKEFKAYIESVVVNLRVTQTKFTYGCTTHWQCLGTPQRLHGWPEHMRDIHDLMLSYWPERSVLMKGERFMRPDILQKLHQGHQGINKCLARATEAVWGPGIAVQVKVRLRDLRFVHMKPSWASDLLRRRWQRVGAGLSKSAKRTI